jgi:hypothetical protein
MPCFYYSLDTNASTTPKNIPFMEAELGAHGLHKCPLQWQDQYNMNKKSMTPMDMRSLLTLLEAIERICTYDKGKLEFPRSLLTRARKGRNLLVLIPRPGFPRKFALRSIATCARSMGAHIPCTTLVIVIGLKRTERRNQISTPLRKAERKVVL